MLRAAAAVAAGVPVLFKFVVRLRGQVLAVIADKRRVQYREGVARRQPQRGAGGADLLVLRLPHLLADARIELAVVVVNEMPRPVVDVDGARLRRGRVLPRLQHPRVRLAEVVVVDAVHPRRYAVLQRPQADALFAGAAAGRRDVVRDRLVAAERPVLLRRVHQHQRVPVRLVAEVVVDPFQLHQAADKAEAALLVLHAVLPAAVAAGQPIFQRHVVLAQQGFDDLRHRLALENAQIFVTLQRPQVRLHHQVVHGIARAAQRLAADRDFGDFAVQVARVQQPLSGNAYGDRLAEQRPALDARIGA